MTQTFFALVALTEGFRKDFIKKKYLILIQCAWQKPAICPVKGAKYGKLQMGKKKLPHIRFLIFQWKRICFDGKFNIFTGKVGKMPITAIFKKYCHRHLFAGNLNIFDETQIHEIVMP